MMRKTLQFLTGLLICMMGCLLVTAQDRCGSMVVLDNLLNKNPLLRTKYNAQTQRIRAAVIDRKANAQHLRTENTPIYIPIVFHIVLTNPNVITDAQIQAQVDQLNMDFGGVNGDSVFIPAAFKSLYAKGNIQFRLAQRTPTNESATGIERRATTQGPFGLNDSRVKYFSTGGADAWDNQRFFNVWITDLSQGYLGYSSFPGSGPDAEDGVVIKSTTLPGGNSPYNRGRTLVHETGHFFYLFHIWGDEDGCAGSDDIADTPNQGPFTSGCPSGIKTDNCTTTAPGIMYQNFMDYTDDACMVMFTLDQKTRMETALGIYRASLGTSNGADPVITYNRDVAVKSINNPLQRICSPSFAPVVTIRNRGAQTITSLTIKASIDTGVATTVTNWTGNLPSLTETTVTLGQLTVNREGNHILQIEISSPNGLVDENLSNDILYQNFTYYQPLPSLVTQSFEHTTFPPVGWDLVNPDKGLTWERTQLAAKTGNAAVVLRTFDYVVNAQKDQLRLPTVNLANADSAYLTFQLAAAAYTDPTKTNVPFDTLEVLVSRDCGATFTSLFKKGGKDLITRTTATEKAFVPTAEEWRKDSVNLTPYINGGQIIVAFSSINNNENNIYLDDVNVYSYTVNPNVREKGFLVYPNPTKGRIDVQFFPNPALVKGINIFNSSGVRVVSRTINSTGSGSYSFDLTAFGSGVYTVQVVTNDGVKTQKVIKR